MAKAALEIVSSQAFNDGTGDIGYDVWGIDEDTGIRIGSRHISGVRLLAENVAKLLSKPDTYPKELQKELSKVLPLSWSKEAMEAAINGDEEASTVKTDESTMQEANPDTQFPLVVGV